MIYRRRALMEEMRELDEFAKIFAVQRTRLLGELIRALIDDLNEEIE